MSILFYNVDILSGNYFFKNACLGVEGDTIDYIGENRPPKNYDISYDMSGKLLIPGLYNMHTHTAMSAMRGVGGGLPLDRWLNEVIFPIEARMTVDDVKVGSAIAIMEMLASGVVSFTDMYDKCLATAEVVLESGIKANLSRAIMGFDSYEKYEDNIRVRESIELFEYTKQLGIDRLKADFSVHAEYTSNEKLITAYAEDILDRGGAVHIHLSETKKEHKECKSKYSGRTSTKLFYDCGLLKVPTIAAHCVHLEDNDIDILAKCCATIVHCPSSNLKLGSGIIDIGRLFSAGINVCIGTDGNASNNNQNLIEEAHLATLLSGVASTSSVSSATWLNSITRNGAKAQRRENCGELAIGNKADIVAIDMDKPHLKPVHDVLELLMYSVQASDVCMTMVDGKILYRNGEYLTMDKEKIYYELNKSVKRLFNI